MNKSLKGYLISGAITFIFSVATFFLTTFYNEKKLNSIVRKEVQIALSKMVEIDQISNDNFQIVSSNLGNLLSAKRIPNSNIEILNNNIDKTFKLLDSVQIKKIKDQEYELSESIESTVKRIPASTKSK